MKSNTHDDIPNLLNAMSNSIDVFENDDPNVKDKFGCTKALRYAITRQYEIIEILGKGSYGCVSKGKCKVSGRIVALKVMEN